MLLMILILICVQYGHVEYYSRGTFFQVNDVYFPHVATSSLS